MKKPIKITEADLSKLIHRVLSEQIPMEVYDEEVISRKEGFTSKDRNMLNAIYDVLVKGGSAGGYKSGRKRSLTPIGAVPQFHESQLKMKPRKFVNEQSYERETDFQYSTSDDMTNSELKDYIDTRVDEILSAINQTR